MEDKENKKIEREPIEIEITKLQNYPNNQFAEYNDKRLSDLVESVKARGVLEPILIRPSPNNGYYFQILAGHNRKNAAKIAGLEKIPAVIYHNLTEAEAELIVTETNLIQRSFADLKHSERAYALYTFYNAIKKKSGYRTDLVNMVDELTSSPLANRLSLAKVGEKYGLKKDTIFRYVRVHSLVDELKKQLDNNLIPLRAAVELSYLDKYCQEIVSKRISYREKVNINLAQKLHRKSEKKEGLDVTAIIEILSSKPVKKKIKSLKLSDDFISKYYKDYNNPEEFEKLLAELLDAHLSKTK